MKAMRVMVLGLVAWIALAAGCASTGDEASTTQVDGMVVSDGADDWDREYSDEEVRAFAAAYVEVTNIQQRYQRQMTEANDEAERQALNRESAERAEEAMRSHGVTPQEYNNIAIRLPDDDELRARVREAVQEMETQRREETQRNLENQ